MLSEIFVFLGGREYASHLLLYSPWFLFLVNNQKNWSSYPSSHPDSLELRGIGKKVQELIVTFNMCFRW